MPEAESDVLLRLRFLPASTPADVRLAAALKTFLRRYRIRCVEVRSVPRAAATPVPLAPGQDVVSPEGRP